MLCAARIGILTILALASLVDCQTNGTFVDQSHYTTFELFKNTRLSQCPINATQVTNPLIEGDTTGNGGRTVVDIVASDWVSDQANYCKHMKGAPVMIPTMPTQNAFTPWWPTFATQFASLLIAWVSLWWTSRGLNQDPEASDMSLPSTFWISLPLDCARITFWFFQTIRGFADARRFGWVSVLLWLLPFNYIYLFRLVGNRRENTSAGGGQEMSQTDSRGQSTEYTAVRQGGLQAHETMMARPDFQIVSEHGAKRRRPILFWVSTVVAFITFLQWCLSLTVVALHFRYSWFDKSSHPTYVAVSGALADPSSIATMPQACLDWLNSSPLATSELLDINVEQTVMTLLVAIQFVICTIVVVINGAAQSGHRRTLGMLKVSAWASLATLGLPAIGTGFWVLGAVIFGNQDAWLTYTNNLNTTGGCTFGVVGMDRRWGYWDVEYQRPYRIAMSVLGAA